jgi:hypothetical protein
MDLGYPLYGRVSGLGGAGKEGGFSCVLRFNGRRKTGPQAAILPDTWAGRVGAFSRRFPDGCDYECIAQLSFWSFPNPQSTVLCNRGEITIRG